MHPEPKPADATVLPAPQISPEAYNAVINQLTPTDVRLEEVSFTLKAAIHSGPLFTTAELAHPERGSIARGGDDTYFEIRQAATFRLAASDGMLAAEGRAVYMVRVKSGFEPPEEFWPIFMLRNVKLYTHPALRDLVAGLATRAGLMALPLGSVAVTQSVSRPSIGYTAEAKKPLPPSK